MMVVAELIVIRHPEEYPDVSSQAAQLILEIGTYKKTKDVDMILGYMAQRTTVAALDSHEQVIGTAGLVRIEANPSLGVLDDVIVDPQKRGLGLGRKVVEAIEDIASREGVLELYAGSSRAAVPFYAHLGYKQLSELILRKFL